MASEQKFIHLTCERCGLADATVKNTKVYMGCDTTNGAYYEIKPLHPVGDDDERDSCMDAMRAQLAAAEADKLRLAEMLAGEQIRANTAEKSLTHERRTSAYWKTEHAKGSTQLAAAEVRVREEIERGDKWLRERDELRAQLAAANEHERLAIEERDKWCAEAHKLNGQLAAAEELSKLREWAVDAATREIKELRTRNDSADAPL